MFDNNITPKIHSSFSKKVILSTRADNALNNEERGIAMYENEKHSPMLKSVEQMRAFSGLTKRQLYSMIRNGEVGFVRCSGRYYFTEQDVWEWYQRNKHHVDTDRSAAKTDT